MQQAQHHHQQQALMSLQAGQPQDQQLSQQALHDQQHTLLTAQAQQRYALMQQQTMAVQNQARRSKLTCNFVNRPSDFNAHHSSLNLRSCHIRWLPATAPPPQLLLSALPLWQSPPSCTRQLLPADQAMPSSTPACHRANQPWPHALRADAPLPDASAQPDVIVRPGGGTSRFSPPGAASVLS